LVGYLCTELTLNYINCILLKNDYLQEIPILYNIIDKRDTYFRNGKYSIKGVNSIFIEAFYK